jgi:nucleotide-binding universal stress UspA family protein
LAERAVPYAVRLAQASQARVVLMQAVPESMAAAQTYLADMAESMSGQVAAVEVATPIGRPTEKILETIDAFQADGVVMATRGRTGLEHLLHASVTEEILARSGVPVFVVYAQAGEASLPDFSPTDARLLVPQDGSAYDAPALHAAMDILGPRGEIVLTTVVEPPDHVETDDSGRHVLAYLDQQEEATTREAREYLAAVAETLRTGAVPVSVRTNVQLGDPALGIVMAAHSTNADVIVMATHGRTGIRRAVAGSVAGTVVRTASTPVVLVHPSETPPPDGATVERPAIEVVGAVPTF